MELKESQIDKIENQKTLLPKLMILGYGRHGKDTVADYLVANYGYRSISSSLFAAEKVVYPVLKDKYGYTSVEECYNDRHNHRVEWFDLIAAYNTPDGAKLARDLYAAYDIYVGIRNPIELDALKAEGAFAYAFWVEREGFPPEDAASCGVTLNMANYKIENYGTLEDLYTQIDSLMSYLGIQKQTTTN